MSFLEPNLIASEHHNLQCPFSKAITAKRICIEKLSRMVTHAEKCPFKLALQEVCTH
jgi:hypothetical protein